MLDLIDELENLLQRATRLPATGKVLLDEAAVQRIIDQMREAVPDEVKTGQRISAERERILADARAQARRIQEDAQAQVSARLDDQGLVQAARQRTREIQHEAEQEAAKLRADANNYVTGQLSALEARLQRILREVQAGQRALSADTAKRPEGQAKAE
jgi:vacuolar-type H+-ATPase subunit H